VAADIVFAKDTLATYCVEHSILYTPYTTLATVAQRLDEILASETRQHAYRGKASSAV